MSLKDYFGGPHRGPRRGLSQAPPSPDLSRDVSPTGGAPLLGSPSTYQGEFPDSAASTTAGPPTGGPQQLMGGPHMGNAFCDSPRTQSPSCGKREDWGLLDASEGCPGGPPQVPPSEAHQEEQEDTKPEIWGEGALWKPRRRHLRQPMLSPGPSEGPEGSPLGGAPVGEPPPQADPIRDNNIGSKIQPSGYMEGPRSSGYTRKGPPGGTPREERTGLGRPSSGSVGTPAILPSLGSPTARRQEEASGNPPEAPTPLPQGPPRTVKMQAYKQLHSHHYLVSGAHEVIRVGALAGGGGHGGPHGDQPPASRALRMSESDCSSPGPPEPTKTAGGPRGPFSGAVGWRPFVAAGDTPFCSYEGPKALRLMARKGTRGPPSPDVSPRRRSQVTQGCTAMCERDPPLRSSTRSSSSRQQQPFHALQSRLSEIIGLPVLSKMASALGARDWLRGRSRSNTTSLTGESLGTRSGGREPPGGPIRSSKGEGRDAIRGQRAVNRDRGEREDEGPFEQV